MRSWQKYDFIRHLPYDVKALCVIAGVSRSGYYKWLQDADLTDKDYQEYILIKEIFDKHRRKAGFRTIKMQLQTEKGIVMNHKKIIRIMNKYSLCAKIRNVNPYRQIMRKTHEHKTFPNLLNRNFQQYVPYKAFCTDITYLPYNKRLAYLSVIKDLASGEIVAWYLSESLAMEIVLKTLDMMSSHDLPISSFDGIMIHSDQGFHYTHPEYIHRIKKLGMIQSMSCKGNCIDNAPIESFFGHLKDDIDYRSCHTFAELKQLVSDYMIHYNFHRCQWTLKKMTPVCYRNHLLLVSG